MELELHGKVAIVTGASSGIGRAAAASLLGEGAEVVIASRDEARIQRAGGELEAETGRAPLAVAADVTDVAAIERLVETTRQRCGAPQVVVVNAGGPPSGPFESHDDGAWETTFRLNLMSGVRLVRAVLPAMREAGWGRIIFLTSLTVRQPEPGLILSNSLRAGVTGFAKTLSREVAADGITVNSICTGFTDTERLNELAAANAARQGTTPDAIRQGWLDSIPAGRLGEPREIGDAVAFLASARAAYITGVALQVDGGYVRGLI
jgi:3-oxoacyl-[acyl-carrier protein] reductase